MLYGVSSCPLVVEVIGDFVVFPYFSCFCVKKIQRAKIRDNTRGEENPIENPNIPKTKNQNHQVLEAKSQKHTRGSLFLNMDDHFELGENVLGHYFDGKKI